MESFLFKLLDEAGAVLSLYPKVFVGLLGIGLLFGWTGAWLILKNRIEHQKEILDQYEKIITDKIPGFIPKSRPGTSRVIWVAGLAVILIFGGAIYYLNQQIAPLVHSAQRKPRSLSDDQKAALLAAAKDFRQKMADDAKANKTHGTTAGVFVWAVRDWEPMRFARMIREAISPSDLVLGPITPVDIDERTIGVKILIKNMSLKDEAITDLQEVLKKGGIDTDVLPDDILYQGQVVIWVAYPPE